MCAGPPRPHVGRRRTLAPKDRDHRVRSFAIGSLGQLKEPRAVEPLIAILGDKSEPARLNEKKSPTGEVFSYTMGNRAIAARSLAGIGDPRAIEPLIAAMKDEDRDLCREAIAGLARFKDARAFDGLVAALKDPDQEIRYTGAWALGELGDPRAIEPLTAAQSDSSQTVSESATRAIKSLREKSKRAAPKP